MDSVLTALFATGVVRATGVGYDRVSSALQKPRVSAKLDPLADEFHGSFKERLFDVADQLDDNSISRIAGYWEEIVTDLDTNALGFDDGDDPVDVIVDTIYRHDYTDTTELNRGNVHRAVSAAYAETIDEFCDQVAEDDELANRLNHHLGVQIVNKLDDLRAVAADIEDAVKPTERYVLYRSDRVDLAVGQFVERKEPEFVDREEVDEAPESERLVVTGPIGSGKTRVLAELLDRWTANERVEHVMVVDRETMKMQDQWAFEFEEFEGDVVMVWEDAGRSADEFETVVSTLENHVSDQGNRLRVLAEVRAERIEEFPTDTIKNPDSIRKSSLSFWGPFDVVELDRMSEANHRTLVERFAEKNEIDLEPAAYEKLVKQLADSSAPGYLRAVFRTVEQGGTLDLSDVEELPDSAIGVWKKAYDRLRSNGTRDELKIIRACRLLYDIGLSSYAFPLVWGVYKEVLRGPGGKDDVGDGVNNLVQWGWVDERNREPETESVNQTELRLHATQVEAVEMGIESYRGEISEFILYSATRYADDWREDGEALLNWAFADSVRDSDEDRAEAHYLQALELTSPTDDPLDSALTEAHNNYANLLKNLDDREDDAENHYLQALELTSPTDNPLDSDYAKAHYNYAILLEERDDLPEAKEHSERSVELWIERGRYRNAVSDSLLLVPVSEELEDHTDALEYCQLALGIAERVGISSDHPLVRELHVRYAMLSARDPADSIRDSYRLGLLHHNHTHAITLLTNGWERRDELPQQHERRWMALACGVWLSAYDDLTEGVDEIDREDVREAVEPETQSLSRIAHLLYELVFEDVTPPPMEELDEELDTSDPMTETELDAFEKISEALSD